MSISRISNILISISLIWIILITLKGFLIPLVFAIAIWVLIRKLRNVISSNPVIKVPYWLGTTLASLTILVVLYIFSQLLTGQIQNFLEEDNLNKYEKNFQSIGNDIVNLVGIDALDTIQQKISEMNFTSALQELFSLLSNLLGNSFIVLLYLLFLILEENLFKIKLGVIYPDKSRRDKIKETISEITYSVESYVTLKTLVSLITGVASYIALYTLGVDFPVFWAILIFLLNYIPTVGSLIATIFPALMALIEFQEFSMFFYVLIVIGVIQLIVGNIIEPRVMGNSLNISPLVVILSLTLWSVIWGVVGMILSVPIMVVVIIVLSKIPSTRNLAIMLSSNGKV